MPRRKSRGCKRDLPERRREAFDRLRLSGGGAGKNTGLAPTAPPPLVLSRRRTHTRSRWIPAFAGMTKEGETAPTPLVLSLSKDARHACGVRISAPPQRISYTPSGRYPKPALSTVNHRPRRPSQAPNPTLLESPIFRQ
ncbi:hypothetical protein AEB_P1725 [Altererythrobacter sp. B11]|nr:hypothetical protein AEB_P1725 [Altererythrobacter sp. B11]